MLEIVLISFNQSSVHVIISRDHVLARKLKFTERLDYFPISYQRLKYLKCMTRVLFVTDSSGWRKALS
jgi:hypothetical protein